MWLTAQRTASAKLSKWSVRAYGAGRALSRASVYLQRGEWEKGVVVVSFEFVVGLTLCWLLGGAGRCCSMGQR